MDNYYCQQKCGEVDFSITEWNKSYLEIEAMPISQAKRDKLIDGEPCKNQCFDCMAIVGETRRKNRTLNKLEKKLDKALAKETKESLIKWLKSNRVNK